MTQWNWTTTVAAVAASIINNNLSILYDRTFSLWIVVSVLLTLLALIAYKTISSAFHSLAAFTNGSKCAFRDTVVCAVNGLYIWIELSCSLLTSCLTLFDLSAVCQIFLIYILHIEQTNIWPIKWHTDTGAAPSKNTQTHTHAHNHASYVVRRVVSEQWSFTRTHSWESSITKQKVEVLRLRFYPFSDSCCNFGGY